MVEAPSRQRSRTPRPGEAGRLQRLTAGPTTRDVRSALTWIVGLSILARLVLSTVAHAPVIFSDELGYVKLAESIGRTGHLGLFDHRGLSYSPLYPIVLAPVYALGVSAPTAYLLIKVVNAVLMSLAILPTYRIARFVLSQRDSVIVAALSALAPLMFYASFSMSENLAYPLCLCAIWAMLEATRSPGLRTDAVFLGAALLATAARVELVLLVPAALTAFLLAALLERQPGGPLRRVLAAVTRHGLLFGVVAAALAVAGAAALGGKGVFSVFGRYAEVGRIGLPGFDRFLTVLVRHVAELDLAVGVVPFVAAIVCAIALARRRFRGRALPFAAVATSLTVWLLAEIAYDGALYDGAGGELVRIHERWLIYVFPLFLVALLATVRVGRELVSNRAWILVCAGAALLPLAIPFHTVINQASAVDTFGLQPLAHTKNGVVVPIPFVAAAAVAGAAVLCLLFVQVRGQTRATVLLVLIPLVFISGQVMSRVSSGS